MARTKRNCPICETKIRNVKRHLLEVHATGKKYAVKACRQLVDSRKGNGALRCEICSRRYENLSVHMLRKHGGLSKKARTSMIREAKLGKAKPDAIAITSEDEEWQPPVANDSREKEQEKCDEIICSSEAETSANSERDLWSEIASESASDNSDPESSPADLDALIYRYERWLQTWVGGKAKAEHASEMASKIRRMQEHGLASVDRFIDSVLVARMFEEMPEINKWKPGTTTAYICAYKNFLEYLLIADIITADARNAALVAVSRIGTAVYKARRQRDSERACSDEKLVLEGEQLQVSTKRDVKVSEIDETKSLSEIRCDYTVRILRGCSLQIYQWRIRDTFPQFCEIFQNT